MKIKKVEIQAFRAYNKAEDCTFDFQTSVDKYADFVSIYAPNGFGKTSFYDAVEWGITNNIYRFVKHNINKDYAHDEKAFKYELDKNKSPQYILRHKHSPEKLEGYVKLFLANPEDEKFRKVPTALRIDSTDYDFEDKNTENVYFRKVILSQDSIDSFLKEDRPELRYKKFIDFFGNKELDTCYTNVLHLIKANDSKISLFEKQIKALEDEVPVINDSDLLNKINSKIIELKLKGEDLKVVEPDFTDSDFLDFSNTVTSNKLSTKQKIEELQKIITLFRNKELDIELHFISKQSLTTYTASINQLKEIKSIFNKISEIKNQVNSKIIFIEEKVNDLLLIEEIQDLLPSYYKITRNIKDRKIAIDDYTININSKQAAVRQLQAEITDLRSKSEVILNAVYDAEKKLLESNDLDDFLKENQLEIDSLSKLIDDTSKYILELDKEINESTLQVRSLEFELTQLNDNKIPNSIKTENKYFDIVSEISIKQNLYLSIQKDVQAIDLKISLYNNLQNDLDQLSLLSLKVVDNFKKSNCPSCGQNYNSHIELIERIKNNSLVDQEYIRLTMDRSEKFNKFNELESQIFLLKSEITNEKEQIISKLRSEIDQKSQIRNHQSSLLTESKNLLLYFESIKREQFLFLNGLSVNQYQNKLTQSIAQFNIDFQTISKNLESKLSAENFTSNEIISMRKSLSLMDAEVKNLESSRDYLKINKFLLKNSALNIVNESSITDLIKSKQKEIEKHNKELELLKNELTLLNTKIEKFNENKVIYELQLLEELHIKLQKEVSVFNQFIITHFGSNSIDNNQAELFNKFEHLINSNIETINTLTEIFNNYQIIEEFKENVLPLLKFRSNQLKIELLKSNIQFQNNISTHLYKERDKLSAYINHQIESFFYEDLINTLYKKIDPHPEYKKIVFKCDFGGDVPKLNVFVNGNGTEHLIPNLYFSTAQMNILSLSIFLAKAINAKDDLGNPIDCIFIDDPIQSMDSINILSTIDLLRSISINLKKQIILSTHDENFHNLLKRKMPPSSFNSKFIELETFGKVKKQ